MNEGSLISPFSNYFINQIDEFYILGIKTIDHAKKLITDVYYRGEALFSVPNQWAYFTDTKETINAFQFKIPEKNPGNSYFALSINEMQINVSYLHCLVIYQDVTELINSAKMLIDDDVIECFQPRSEQKEGYILNPVEIKRNQAKYFYPFNFVIKTKSQHHRFFRKVLEELAKILEENPFPYKDLNEVLLKEQNLHLMRMVKFSANLFFLLNNLIKPSTSTEVLYRINKEVASFSEKSVLKYPYSDDPILLSILELEVESAIFLWKSLIIGSNVIVISEDNQKRFNIMEALSYLTFPLSPPIKVSSFVLRLDMETNKLLLSASHFFIGYSSRFITMEKLLSDDYIVENCSLCDLDHSTYYPQNKPNLDLGTWERQLKEKLISEKQIYLQKMRNIRKDSNFEEEMNKIQRETCYAISKEFFAFFENEEIFTQVESFLNLKKVEILSDHKSILKQQWKLIELSNRPKEFIRTMIEEYSFNTFARELISIDLNPSFRFKNIVAAISYGKKNKEQPANPVLKQFYEINKDSIMYFVRKVIESGGLWTEEKYETIKMIFEAEKNADVTNDETLMALSQIKTPIVSSVGTNNLIDFLMGLSSNFVFLESEEQSLATDTAKSFNFNEIIQNDIENAVNKKGQIFDLIDYNDSKKHLWTINKALIFSSFSSDGKGNKECRLKTLRLFMQSYQEYLQFELDSKINKGLPQNPCFDFPDFPRSEFSKFLSTKAKDLDLEAYSQEFKLLNPKSNIVSLISKRTTLPKSKFLVSTDTIENFPTICYNYLNFLKNFFRSNNLLSTLINVTNPNKLEIRRLFKKLANEEKHNLKQIDEVFSSMENDTTVHFKEYSDEEKLCFYLNFFNLKLLHEMLFYHLTNETKAFPKNSREWMEFLSSVKFRLFGLSLNLWEFDSTIIRQKLNVNHLFIPVTSFFTKFTGLNEGDLFDRQRNNISEEYRFFKRKSPIKRESLIHFSQFFCIRDTPIYVIFDDPKTLEETLIEHTREHFKFFKKINNFNYLKDPKSLQVPVPIEFLQSQHEDVTAGNEIIKNFLIEYYDNRIREVRTSQIIFKEVYIQWNMFYLNPSYFA